MIWVRINFFHICLNLALFTFSSISLCTGSLHSTFHHFESLKPHQISVREKRSASGKETVRASFWALQKRFNMMLTPGARVLHPRVEASLVDETGTVTPFSLLNNKFFSGTLDGHATHEVDASESDGVWMVHIHTPHEFYAVEPMRFYDSTANERDMIVYRTRDIKLDNITTDHSFCKEVFFEEPPKNQRKEQAAAPRAKTTGSKLKADMSNIHHFKDDSERTNKQHVSSFGKSKRQVSDKPWREEGYSLEATDCDVVAVADFNLFKGIGNRSPTSIVRTLVHVYSLVDKVFRETDFGDVFNGRKYGIVLRGMIIHTNYSHSATHYNSPNLTMSAHDVLVAMTAHTPFINYCLAHLTTQRNTGVIIGLAARASPGEYWDNGICAAVEDSFPRNVGTSTVVGPTGLIQPMKVYSQIVAHEIGHNWGAHHDPQSGNRLWCSPSNAMGGKYLMWFRSGFAENRNAFQFSPCSKEDIRAVLKRRAHRCFLEKGFQSEVCGNGILDAAEECDPGIGNLHTDPCCQSNCGLRPRAQCSFRNSPCCTPNCTIAPATQECYPKGGLLPCYKPSHCTGSSSQICPRPKPDENGAPCELNGACLFGRCMSYCERIGRAENPVRHLKPCPCDNNVTAMCRYCCVDLGILNGTCQVMGGAMEDGSVCLRGNCFDGICMVKEVERQSFILDTGSLIRPRNDAVNASSSSAFQGSLLCMLVLMLVGSIKHPN